MNIPQNFKLVPQLNRNGVFVGMVAADENPRRPGSYLIPGGAVDMDPPEYIPEGHLARLVDGVFVIEPIPVVESEDADTTAMPVTEESLRQAAVDAVQQTLDNKARTRGYDGILSLCTYAVSSNPKFAAEGQAGVAWRDAAWTALYTYQSQVAAATLPAPTTHDEAMVAALARLPGMSWPDEIQEDTQTETQSGDQPPTQEAQPTDEVAASAGPASESGPQEPTDQDKAEASTEMGAPTQEN